MESVAQPLLLSGDCTCSDPRETRRPEPPRFRGVGEPCWIHSAAAMASVAFLAPIQATTPNPILLIMSAML